MFSDACMLNKSIWFGMHLHRKVNNGVRSMNYYLHTFRQCHDKEYIWVFDFVIGGLFRVNKETNFVECILSPMDLYNMGCFEIQKLIDWNDYVIIIPVNISKEWLLVNKTTKEVKRFCPISTQFSCSDAIRMENRIICIPSKVNEPIAVVDVCKKKCTNLIYQWFHQEDNPTMPGKIWYAINVGSTIYLPMRGLDYIGMTDGIQTKVIKMDLDEPIAAADYCAKKWWVSTFDGRSLYCLDETGKLLERFSLENQFICVRLIATDRFIFMLPDRGKSICVFDIKLSVFKIITVTDNLPEEVYTAPYWNYLYADNSLLLLPFFNPCIIIDIDTLEIKYKEIVYTSDFIKEYYWEYRKEHWLLGGRKPFREDTKSSLQELIRFTETVNVVKGDVDSKIGMKIWENQKKG